MVHVLLSSYKFKCIFCPQIIATFRVVCNILVYNLLGWVTRIVMAVSHSLLVPLNKVHIEIFRLICPLWRGCPSCWEVKCHYTMMTPRYHYGWMSLFGRSITRITIIIIVHVPIIGIQCIHVHSELSDQT